MLMSMETSVQKMSRIIAVFSNVNRLTTCLVNKMPNFNFREVKPDSPNALAELENAEIVIADYDLLSPYLYNLPSVKWVQGTWAGAEALLKKIDRSKPPLPYTVTRFTGDYFGSVMAEYVVTSVVMHERNWDSMIDNRRKGVWLKEEQFQLNSNDHRGIYDLTFGILGLGAIGSEIARVLKTLGGKTWGMVRSLPEKTSPYVDKYLQHDNLPSLLKTCDYIINVLPSTSDTIGLLNGDILQNCSDKKTVFVNIGRGTVIKESDLVNALEKKWLAAAILDVFEVEPLPVSSPLWKMPQVMITPHIAGVTKAEYVVDLFGKNYERFEAGLPLNHIIDVSKGY